MALRATLSRTGLVLSAALALAAGAVPAFGQGIEQRRAFIADEDAPGVMVVAHRGCWRDTAENSIAAIEGCVVMGVDMVELDVRRTRDGALVLMHDETVDRTTDGVGRVADLTLEQIRGLRLRAGAGGPEAGLTDARPPTFAEALQAARGRVLINLDAKADVYDEAFADLTRLGLTDHILMKRRVAPGDGALAVQPPFDQVFAMPIADQAVGDAGSVLADQAGGGPVAVELIFTDLSWLEAAVPEVQRMDARVWVNTLNPALAAGLVDADAVDTPDAVWGALILRGVSMIQTDEPAALIAYLRRLRLR